jgi:hypothetical protein
MDEIYMPFSLLAELAQGCPPEKAALQKVSATDRKDLLMLLALGWNCTVAILQLAIENVLNRRDSIRIPVLDACLRGAVAA